MSVEVKDGKIVSSTGALAKTIPNSLQSTAADQVHTTARIQHPSIHGGFHFQRGHHINTFNKRWRR